MGLWVLQDDPKVLKEWFNEWYAVKAAEIARVTHSDENLEETKENFTVVSQSKIEKPQSVSPKRR